MGSFQEVTKVFSALLACCYAVARWLLTYSSPYIYVLDPTVNSSIWDIFGHLQLLSKSPPPHNKPHSLYKYVFVAQTVWGKLHGKVY